MKTRIVLSLLLSFLMAIGVMAEEKSSLFVFLKDGSKVQFFLPSQDPTVKYQKGVMTVSYRGLDASEQTLDFERDQTASWYAVLTAKAWMLPSVAMRVRQR